MARTSEPSYVTLHGWIRADRGPASDWLCAAHGDYPYPHWAEQWCYTGFGGSNERTGVSHSRGKYHYEYRYSLNTGDYVPVCREAHSRLDAIHRNAAGQLEDQDDSGMWLL